MLMMLIGKLPEAQKMMLGGVIIRIDSVHKDSQWKLDLQNVLWEHKKWAREERGYKVGVIFGSIKYCNSAQ